MNYTGYLDLTNMGISEKCDFFKQFEKKNIRTNGLTMCNHSNYYVINNNELKSLGDDAKKYIQFHRYKNITSLFLLNKKTKRFFVATAMSNLSKDEYKSLQASVKKLKNNFPMYDMFAEITTIKDHDNFMSPEEATIIDIQEIQKCSHFVLFHLSDIQSSTLFELGIAHSLKKDITIFYQDENHLPFMLKELHLVSDWVKLIKIENLEDEIIQGSFE